MIHIILFKPTSLLLRGSGLGTIQIGVVVGAVASTLMCWPQQSIAFHIQTGKRIVEWSCTGPDGFRSDTAWRFVSPDIPAWPVKETIPIPNPFTGKPFLVPMPNGDNVYQAYWRITTVIAIIWTARSLFINAVCPQYDPLSMMHVKNDEREKNEDLALKIHDKAQAGVENLLQLGKEKQIKIEPVSWRGFSMNNLWLIYLPLKLDLLWFDLSVICFFIGEGHIYFTIGMTVIFVSAAVKQCKANIWSELKESGRMGVKTANLMGVLENERGYEAFWSLCLTTYTMPFSAVASWKLINMLLSITFGAFSIASLLQETHALMLYTPADQHFLGEVQEKRSLIQRAIADP